MKEGCYKCGKERTGKDLRWWQAKPVCNSCYEFEHDAKYLGDLGTRYVVKKEVKGE